MSRTVALFGAAGKIGTRIAEKLCDSSEYEMLYVEAGAAGEQRLTERGLTPSSQSQAVSEATVIILAIPDVYIGRAAREIVPQLRPGAMVICLDPAAPYSGELPEREDITYFVTHPCHPPINSDETTPEGRADYFGGIAEQHIVCALMQGPESDYAVGEDICRRMFAPVGRAHRVNVEQMALLEPAMSETVVLTCMTVIREAMEEVIAMGVPAEAARDFMLGHINTSIAILFGFLDAQVSDGARMAAERAKKRLFKPDWKSVFELENVQAEVRAITQGILGN